MARRLLAPFVLALFAVACGACGGCGKGRGEERSQPDASAAGTGSNARDAEREGVLDLVDRFDDCAVGHHGLFVDLGGRQARALLTNGLVPVQGDDFEREGATWFRSRERTLTFLVFSPADIKPADGVTFEARMRGVLAKHVAVHVNGRSLGSTALPKGESRTFTLKSHDAGIVAGMNEITLHLSGGGKAAGDVVAEIDWLRIGGDGDGPYAAPTRADVVTQATLGGASRPALSLRDRSFVRCAALLPKGARFEIDLGLSGKGEADVELRLLVDRKDPLKLQDVHLGPADANAWRPISVALPEADTIGAVEVVVGEATKGARVFLGAPRVTAPKAPPAVARPAPAKNVVILALGMLPRRSLALHGGSRALPEIDRLAARGMIFDDARATSALASAALASILTGLPPRAHGLTDTSSTLLKSVVTVEDAAHQAGFTTAMFTANPETYASFGFAHGFDVFGTHVPLEEAAATKVFDLAAKFIEAHKDDKVLLVVHARGAHPPWDATAEELMSLPPNNYAGGLEPKHAAELLGRAQLTPPRWTFTDPDRVRALALAQQALAAHDAAVGRLVGSLRATGKLEDTAWFITGDVGADEAQRVPYGPSETLDEATLAVPLVIVPAGAKVGSRVAAPVSSVDLARTILSSLGLASPDAFRGRDLFKVAEAREGLRTAVFGIRVSSRLGPFVLQGAGEKETRLCSLVLEPSCASDVRATHPIALGHLHMQVLDDLARDRGVVGEPSAQDPLTNASLRAWGRQM